VKFLPNPNQLFSNALKVKQHKLAKSRLKLLNKTWSGAKIRTMP
jgi:hypothetical protein